MTFREVFREGVRLLRPSKGLFLLLAGIQTLSALSFAVVDPVILKYLIDSLTEGNVRAFVLLIGATFLVNTVIRGLGYVSTLCSRRLSNVICERLVEESFEAFCETPHDTVVRKDEGYFISRVYDEPRKVSEMGNLFSSLLQGGLTALGAVAVCLWLAWEVAVALVVIVPVLVVLARRFGKKIADVTVQGNEEEAQLRGALGRSVEGHKTIHLFGLRDLVHSTVNRYLGTLLGTLYSRDRHRGALGTWNNLFLAYAELAVIIGTGVQVLRGVLTIGGLLAFMTAFWRVVNASRSVTNLIPRIATLAGELQRIREFAQPPTERASPLALSGNQSLVEADEISFGYGDKPILENLSLHMKKGERVLLMGPNGSGKSTLGHLVIGLLSPDGGQVVHVPLEDISALLLPFGFIPGTALDNLNSEKLDVAEQARLDRLAGLFGLGDKLDRDPVSLSQGEQRKLQVLMTLMKPADLYIFDEPLAHVDVDSKAVIMHTILEETEGAGLLVIMHGDEQFSPYFDRIEMLEGRYDYDEVAP